MTIGEIMKEKISPIWDKLQERHQRNAHSFYGTLPLPELPDPLSPQERKLLEMFTGHVKRTSGNKEPSK